ncbi:MAG: hypothetical protein FWC65_02130 [Treponema sp.]|nr:hypothetical protein [Treponema sp.]
MEKVKYSLKNHIQYDEIAYSNFFLSVSCGVCLPFVWMFLFFGGARGGDDSTWLYIYMFAFLTIAMLAPSFLLLRNIRKEKDFFRNCSETDAKIENVSTPSDSEHRQMYWRWAWFAEKGIFVTLSYFSYGKECTVRIYIPKIERTANYFDKYTKIGETVKIVIGSKEQDGIRLKELCV